LTGRTHFSHELALEYTRKLKLKRLGNRRTDRARVNNVESGVEGGGEHAAAWLRHTPGKSRTTFSPADLAGRWPNQ
jgi:hypothetical protein